MVDDLARMARPLQQSVAFEAMAGTRFRDLDHQHHVGNAGRPRRRFNAMGRRS
jgi:hypothetical protein